MPPAKLLIADDHTLVRQGVRHLCEGLGGFAVVAEAGTGTQAVQLARATRPDVILMDIVMPDLDGVVAIRQIISANPAARIIALTMYRQEESMLGAIRAGGRAGLLKTVDAQASPLRLSGVHRGGSTLSLSHHLLPAYWASFNLPIPNLPCTPLTEGEMAVLRLVARGVENQDIAKTLDYSVYTVANRLRTIYEKLHVTNRTQAALCALRHGWVTLDEPPQ